MFDPVDPKQSFPDLEKGILEYWRFEDTFKRSLKHRTNAPTFSFYDGPPFATGLPHYGHLLAGTIKDVIPRYQTMRGNRVERRFGWDCHGLPIENLVEKEYGIKDKREIEERGVAWFNDLCRSSVQRYTKEWRTIVERTGRWVDMDWDYRTMDPEYMESIWWVFKTLYEKGLIYEGLKPMHICPHCATPLSNFEVTQGYRDRTDQSVIMTFPLKDDPKTILLAWTTTPWSLPGNTWLAIGKHIDYAKVRMGDLTYILAAKLVAKVFQDKEYEVVGAIAPQEIVEKRYEPLFPYFVDTVIPRTAKTLKPETYGERVFKVVMDDAVEVSDEEGTGIVHVTSCLGEDSFTVAQHQNVDVIHHVKIDGFFSKEVTEFQGVHVKPEGKDPMATDKLIIEYLKDHHRYFSHFTITHSYPHCWRCDSPLLPYTMSSWFVGVEKMKGDLLRTNAETEWVPAHIRDGRFGKWLEGARDWAISRNRYWGTPLPIWRTKGSDSGSGSEKMVVIGSRDELMARVPGRFTKVTVLRHAQSQGNIDQVYQGHLPGTDLTAEGRMQAERTAEMLAARCQVSGVRCQTVYASPLTRTKDTAGIVAEKLQAKVILDERLREVSFGEYEGKHIDFSDLSYVKARREHKFQSNRPESIYHLAGMEAWEAVHDRITLFLHEVLAKHKGEHIVIVTHADPLQNIRHLFTGEDPFKISHQPYPTFAHPYTFFFDHETKKALDLHKETVDNITWKEGEHEYRRIPEVLDCWFESGAMPYAQQHYPFENQQTSKQANQKFSEPEGFPADFIAEGLDQTRGWFYTLMVLSTALFEKPAFKNCIVNGIVLAEDGRKMSKRLKNYPEPTIIMEKYGADAMRFALMASPAVRGEDLRFSEKYVEEVLRRVILPLWNAYSFFVTYANEAEWSPDKNLENQQTSKPVNPHPLDAWILAEVQDLVNRMTSELEAYNLSATCAELHETIDNLTDWYVRRSRRRFAGKESSKLANQQTSKPLADRVSALQTLHEVLITLIKLLAPFCPFLTEHIFLNLASEPHGSIHLSDWPEVRHLTSEELSLIEKTRLLRTIVSLGMKLRNEATIKVRQPLQKLELVLPKGTGLSSEEKTIIQEELNIREVTILDDASLIAERFIQVNARKLGPRLGSKVQDIIRAAKEGKFTEANSGVVILGETLSSEEALITYSGKEGHTVASERGIVVCLETALSEQLKVEGLARDIIRSIQAFRKEKGLKVADSITLEAEKELQGVLKEHQSLIERETNGNFRKAQEKMLHLKVELSGGKIIVS